MSDEIINEPGSTVEIPKDIRRDIDIILARINGLELKIERHEEKIFLLEARISLLESLM